MAEVKAVSEIVGYVIKLDEAECRRLYHEIAEILAQLGIHSMQGRNKLSAPTIYAVYDELYKQGVAS